MVQTAQYFDIDRRVNYIARYAGALQELFFRWIQPARDTCEAAICAGTNVVYRQVAAVEAAGGFAQVPIGEDVHSGVKLWVARYHTRYLPMVLAKGLAPDSWNALTNQQYRWCRSSMLLMMSSVLPQRTRSTASSGCRSGRRSSTTWPRRRTPVTSVLPTLIMVWFFADTITPSQLPAHDPLGHRDVVRLPARRARLASRPSTGSPPSTAFCHLLAVSDARAQPRAELGADRCRHRCRIHEVPLAASPQRVAVDGRARGSCCRQSLLWAGLVPARGVTEPTPGCSGRPSCSASSSSGCSLPILDRAGDRRVTPIRRVSPRPCTPYLRRLDLTDRRADRAEPSPHEHGPRRTDQAGGVLRQSTRSRATPRQTFRLDIQGLRAVAVAPRRALPRPGVPGSERWIRRRRRLLRDQRLPHHRPHPPRDRADKGRLSLEGVLRATRPAAAPGSAARRRADDAGRRARSGGRRCRCARPPGTRCGPRATRINVRLANEGVDYQQVSGPLSPFQHFWSLAVEEQFYLVWPLHRAAHRAGRPAASAVPRCSVRCSSSAIGRLPATCRPR